MNLNSKDDAIHPIYAIKLGLYTENIDIDVQKIDKSYLEIFKMIIANSSVKNKFENI